jgi:hypothetical protein
MAWQNLLSPSRITVEILSSKRSSCASKNGDRKCRLNLALMAMPSADKNLQRQEEKSDEKDQSNLVVSSDRARFRGSSQGSDGIVLRFPGMLRLRLLQEVS